VRGGPVRGHRARDRLRVPLHAPRRAGPRPARDPCRADVGRAGAGVRTRPAAHRGRRGGEPRPPRSRRRRSRRGARVPLPLGELLAAGRDASGRGTDDGRGRASGLRRMTGLLALEDGTVFRGESVGAEGFAFGEAVFTTAMTGYQEVVTDPSFAEQIICFTAPMVGNYGVDRDRSESGRVHARAVVMREARGPAWTDWLAAKGIPALSGIDTRSLVLRLREHGSMRAVLVIGEADVEEALRACRDQPA